MDRPDRMIRGTSDPDVLGPMTWAAAVAATHIRGPICLDNGMIVQRSDTGHLVPYFLIAGNFTRLTAIDQSTYVAGSPPAGWAETLSAGCTITVAGSPQYITLTAAAGSSLSASLQYTITGYTAAETIAVVATGYADVDNSNANNSNAMTVRAGSRAKASVLLLEWHRGSGVSGIVSSAWGTQQPAIDSVASCVFVLHPDPDAGWAAQMSSRLRYGIRESVIGAGAGDSLQLITNHVSASTASHFYIDRCEVWKGTMT